MKKIITTMVLLSGMVAYAQETNGKVGVNTETPKATLDVQPSTTNLTGTTNEGLLIPRLSKERVAKMASPETSTLVYVNEAATYTAGTDTAADTRVENIDAVGFYHYNGTQWVKHLDTDTNDAEWVYDSVTNRINLKRSGQSTGFVNEVFYDAQTGAYVNKEKEPYVSEGAEVVLGKGAYSLLQKGSVGIVPNVTHNNTRNHKALNTNILNVNETSLLASLRPTTVQNGMNILSDNQSPIYWGVANNSGLIKEDGINHSFLMASSNTVKILKGNVLGYTSAVRSEVYVNSSDEITGSVRGVNSFLSTGLNQITPVKDLLGVQSYIGFGNSTETELVKEKAALFSGYFDYRSYNPRIPQLVGYYYGGTIGASATFDRTVAHYGIYLEDVSKAAQNYAIYTNAGQIRFGDLKGTGNRVVYADENGVLKVGNAYATNTTNSLWTRDETTNTIKLAVNSDGTDRTNAVTIDNAGAVYASSLKGYNGATIFPDYVFQKYYTGNSSIKADYTFKSLSQVEDFVKTNGHLPGYKSAEAIKAQGYVDLMETQLTNVEKIEELYLHSIEQEKVNKTQAEELKEKDAKIQELEARLEKLEKLLK